MGEHVSTYFAHRTRTARTIASIGAAIFVGSSGSAPSQAQDEISPAARCLAANLGVSLCIQLPRTAARFNLVSRSRFEPDVFAHTPDLVIWQVGTNDVAWGGRTRG
jgi:acyl-CoA thioesterase-1